MNDVPTLQRPAPAAGTCAHYAETSRGSETVVSGIPGYPFPAQDPNLHEVREDPDEENPHELTLDPQELPPGLPPLPPRREDDADPAPE